MEAAHPGIPLARSLAGLGLRPAAGSTAALHLHISELASVSTPTPKAGWAVGYTCHGKCQTSSPLVMRWNGKSWKKAALPKASGMRLLFQVSADSATDAWAVGVSCAATCQGSVPSPLVLHWDGKAWSQLPSPVNGSGVSLIQGVTALSPTDVWAAGYTCPANCTTLQTLILHWDGTSWTQATTPSPNPNANALLQLAASSPTQLWAIGQAGLRPLILAGDGSSWTRSASAAPGKRFDLLSDVSAGTGGDAWVGGDYCSTRCGSGAGVRPLLEHWSGSAWAATAAPVTGKGANYVSVVLDTSARSAWASGGYCIRRCGKRTEVDDAMLLRWSGKRWSRYHLSATLAKRGFLLGSSSVSAKNAWMVGRYCTARCGATSETDVPLFLHWNGRKWAKA